MPSGKQRLKLLVILIVAQVGCLAIGLWIHRYLVVSAVLQVAEETVIAKLSEDVGALLALADVQDSGGQEPQLQWHQVRNYLKTKPTRSGAQWLLADANWKTLETFATADDDLGLWVSPEESLLWTSPVVKLDGGRGQVTGMLATSQGRLAAVARRLNGGPGYVVACLPLDRAEIGVSSLAGLLPAAGAIAWAWTSALLVIIVYMVVARFDDELNKTRTATESATLRRAQSLVRTRDAVILGLAKLAESRDEITGHHLERIAAYASRLATALRRHPKYRDVVTPEFLQLIGISSVLHDVGKVGIEDAILLKQGPLTDEERVRIQEHSAIGGRCLLEIERRLGTSNFLQMAREIAVSHHERWDGEGYPDGLIGKEIPLAARIVAIADVYDALSTRRPYKQPLTHDECVDMIRQQAGRQFDPDLVEVFLSIERSFRQISWQYDNDATAGPTPVSQTPLSQPDWQGKDLVSAGP